MYLKKIIFFSFALLGFLITSGSKSEGYNFALNPSIVIQQILFDPNNIETWFYNTGIFNQDLRTSNTPGFQWPKNSGKFAIFTSGLTLAAYINVNFSSLVHHTRANMPPVT